MKLGYYQIFWDDKGTNTFEYRYDKEVKALFLENVIYQYTLVEVCNCK